MPAEQNISIREISDAVREESLRLGFTDCGFSRAGALTEDAERLGEWLRQGNHAGMGYMARHFEKRTDATRLVEGARSVISLLYNYYTHKKQGDPRAPVLSKYAYGKDYHFVMKKKMNLLFNFIKSKCGKVSGRIFVDSAPVLERAWAHRSGLGWIGKNSSLISRRAGSFVFIGELITDLELEYNSVPEGDFCGSCTLCIDSCPTGAILTGRTLDSEKCISYQTIENRGAIPESLQRKMSGRIFGCDICQDVCPWNRTALQHSEADFDPRVELLELSAEEWYRMDREQYNRIFRDSAVHRAGYPKLKDTLGILQKNPGD
jgi:epoxyqueuosine reductase